MIGIEDFAAAFSQSFWRFITNNPRQSID